MKKILILPLLLLTINIIAQTHSCCVKSRDMSVFATNERFIAAHENPLPFVLKDGKGQMITFDTPDGKKANAYVVSSGLKTAQVLFVFHEWWGLNDYIKKEAEDLQKELGNVTVYAVDLYDGKVATTKEQATELMEGLIPERAESIIQGLLNRVGKGSKVTTLGWCMGGGWALQAAILGGPQVKACVMYYGFPEENEEKIKKIKADILYIRATQDEFITDDMVEKFVEDLKKNKIKVTEKSYDAVHAFANPSNPKYNKTFAKDAHRLAVDFIRRGF